MTTAAAKSLFLALVRAPWDEQAAAWSKLIPHDWPGENDKILAEAVAAGTAELFQVTRDGKAVGIVVTEVDHGFNPPELLVRAAYARDMKPCALELGDLLDGIAKSKGCGTVRFHTMRGGLIAKARAHGWQISEVILRKNVSS